MTTDILHSTNHQIFSYVTVGEGSEVLDLLCWSVFQYVPYDVDAKCGKDQSESI